MPSASIRKTIEVSFSPKTPALIFVLIPIINIVAYIISDNYFKNFRNIYLCLCLLLRWI